jgi:hypothetical protein
MLRWFLCEFLGWHRPAQAVAMGWDGVSFTAVCERCGRRILMDSQGNWFSVERR